MGQQEPYAVTMLPVRPLYSGPIQRTDAQMKRIIVATIGQMVVEIKEFATTKEASAAMADVKKKNPGSEVCWYKVEELQDLAEVNLPVAVFLLKAEIVRLREELAAGEEPPKEPTVKRWSNGKVRKD